MRIAIVGASNNPDKYGYKVLKDLKDADFDVVPVNPKGEDILGLKTYPKLSDMQTKPDAVVFVTQPEVTRQVLEEVKYLGIKNVWMQPGAENEEAIKYCQDNDIDCIHHDCIMTKKDTL